MLTHLVRHARTAYSVAYRVNGRSGVDVPLDPTGVEQCREARRRLPLDGIATCIVTGFERTRQTAALLLNGRTIRPVVEDRLNEIDYGRFEGRPFLEYGSWLRANGPWQRPPGARESQREAVVRMLVGLRDVVRLQGPRLVVAHGLLVSIVNATRNGRPLAGVFFPEAPYVTAVTLTDDALLRLVDRLADEIDMERLRTRRPLASESVPTDGSGLATFGAADPYRAEPGPAALRRTGPSEEVDHHHA